MHSDEITEAPSVERTELHPEGGIIRLRANSGYTQKEGWHGKEITVEYTGPIGVADQGHLRGLFQAETERLHEEITGACTALNRREGRA